MTELGSVEVLRAAVVLLRVPQNAVVARGLEGRLRLDEMPRSLVVEGAGGEGAGSEGGEVRQVHAVAS